MKGLTVYDVDKRDSPIASQCLHHRRNKGAYLSVESKSMTRKCKTLKVRLTSFLPSLVLLNVGDDDDELISAVNI